jgi:glycosyltransferase involved in cell wall biosynthesis
VRERKDLEVKIQELNLGNNVEMTGQVPSQEIPLYLKAADLFVLDSQGEGLAHVILEAMQIGTPIIASRHGGNIELIEDSFNGFLVEYNNQGELTEAILELWQDKELQQKFIKNSYEKIKGFNWEDLIAKTLKILKTA